MKLILTQEVAGLGAPGDVVEVKGGYGRNYLVPRGAAMVWTRGAEKEIANLRRAREVREIADRGQAQEIKAQLEGLRVQLPARAGDSGRLFGSITPGDVAEAVSASGGPKIDKRRIEIGNPIKTLGTHEVSVRLHPEVTATITLEVVGS